MNTQTYTIFRVAWVSPLNTVALSLFVFAIVHCPNCPTVSSGYGFVDFDSPAAAQKAVAALKTTGVQAQMAKVRFTAV